MLPVGFLAAVLSAVLSSVATLVQARGARDLERRGAAWYVAGLTLDLVGWAMSAFALRYLPVFASRRSSRPRSRSPSSARTCSA